MTGEPGGNSLQPKVKHWQTPKVRHWTNGDVVTPEIEALFDSMVATLRRVQDKLSKS
ncbi:hypothetical protein [Streptosporangium lutulentum]|uniref:Uncharacterized protein n=1 Tax=Streptosporangium lutulentum TaxID=1461250 RepID=A0ABT9Q6B5_9ACTN|nr:hypothetical protein [Streptosporangium lutulentum]MDP9842278.1 hypothetical protein [Streptosporangium lutulentum]